MKDWFKNKWMDLKIKWLDLKIKYYKMKLTWKTKRNEIVEKWLGY